MTLTSSVWAPLLGTIRGVGARYDVRRTACFGHPRGPSVAEDRPHAHACMAPGGIDGNQVLVAALIELDIQR